MPVPAKEDLSIPRQDNYLSYYVYQDEWKPTRPIGPIGAMSRSPGPAIVNLPSTIGEEGHDPSRPRAPGYKMGIRDDRPLRTLGPGPGAYNVRHWTNKGADKCCAPLIGRRYKDLPTFQTPGPAAYSREKSDRAVFPRPPAYSMRIRGEPLRSFTTPAPNNYNLPSMIGPGRTPYAMAPSYSMGLKLDEALGRSMGIQPTPGPAAYMLPSSDVNKSKLPAYSMGTKAAPPTAGTSTPGPAAHQAQMVKFDKYSTPRFTFGIKHSPFEAFPGFAAEN